LRILYYQQPYSDLGGVSNVGVELPKALIGKVNITYFPSLTRGLDKDRLAHVLKNVRGLSTGKFDIIHFNIVPDWFNPIWPFVAVARAIGVKTVLNIHGFIPIELTFTENQRLIPDSLRLLYSQKIYRFVNKIVVNSQYMFNAIVNYYGIEPSKIGIIPNGVNFKRFSNQKKNMVLIGDPSILYFGNLLARKGVDILIRAIAKAKAELPEIKLHLVGSGDLCGYLKQLALGEKIDRQVVFWGSADYTLVPQYYKGADICVFPSRYEPFGIVILEAFASGKPVIASHVGGIPEIVSDGKNGVLVKPNDPVALSDAIVALSQDDNLRKKLSECALETAARYSWENIAKKYLLLYSDLMNAN